MNCNFDFYTNEFNGIKLSEELFCQYVTPATAHVRRLTFGRENPSFEKDLNLAICAVCDVLFDHDRATVNGQYLTAENNDGYSVSFASDGRSSDQILSKKIYSAAALYLSLTGLMSRRVGC